MVFGAIVHLTCMHACMHKMCVCVCVCVYGRRVVWDGVFFVVGENYLNSYFYNIYVCVCGGVADEHHMNDKFENCNFLYLLYNI